MKAAENNAGAPENGTRCSWGGGEEGWNCNKIGSVKGRRDRGEARPRNQPEDESHKLLAA